MKTFYGFALALFLVLPAQARTDMGLLVGYRLNDGDSRVAGSSIDSKGSLQAGGLAYFPFGNQFMLRTGFVYEQRQFEVKTGSASADAKFAHFGIPFTVMYKVQDFGGIFLGPGLSLKVSDSCGSGDCQGVKSTLMPISLGGHFKVAPQFAVEFYFETAPGKLYDGIEDPTAVVFNAIVTFD